MENQKYYMERLRKIRIHKEVKQIEICNYLKISQSQYSKWESGQKQMSYITYIKICEYLNVSVDYMIGIKKGSIDIDP